MAASGDGDVIDKKAALKCAICYEHFQDPRTLPCHHAFCLDCLRDWTGLNTNQTRLVCPTCRQEAVLGMKGVEELPSHSVVTQANEVKELSTSDKKMVGIPPGNSDHPMSMFSVFT